MIKNNIDDKTVVKIVCGNCIGTAFFVKADLLITTRHNIIDSKTDDEPIFIVIAEKTYNAKIVYCDNEVKNGDVCIIRIEEYSSPKPLVCLCMPMRKGDKYCFMGYPQTILGQVAGSVVEVEIHTPRDIFHITEGFDCTATIIGSFMPSQFMGFSGSPIYNDEGLVVGIITHKLDGCVGLVSITKISDKLKSNDILCNIDYENYDKSPYSRLTNRKKIERAINMAGPRYMRDIHVPTDKLDKYFEYAIKKVDVQNRLKEYEIHLLEIIDVFKYASLPRFNSADYDLLRNNNNFDTSLNNTDLNYLLSMLNKELIPFKGKKGKSDVKKYNLYNLIAKWDSFYTIHCDILEDFDKYYQLKDQPYICITGSAGSGKTHLLCHVAEKYADITNVYLCFGSQFDAQREIEEQLQQIFEFGSGSYLQEINNISQNHRTIIIIDAVNEGIGYYLWQLKLNSFLSKINIYSNICLILSVRDPFGESLNLSDTFTKVKHNGHSDIQKAKKAYFNYYNITDSEIPFETPEFRNPLFLKVFCETFSQLNPYQRNNINKLWVLFVSYVKNKEILISSKIDFDHHLLPVRKFIDDMASLSLTQSKDEFRLNDISRDDAHAISNKITSNRTWSKSLLYWMLEENLLISSIEYNQPPQESDRIGFAYERMGDVFKVISFLRLPQKQQNQILNKIVKSETPQAYNFLVTLSSVISDWDRQKREIFDIYPNLFNKSKRMKVAYMNSLDYRYTQSENVLRIIDNKIFRIVDDKTFFNSFLNNVHKEDNKLNAKLLDEILSKLSFAELNKRWTHTINVLYKEQQLELYYSIDKILYIEKEKSEERYNYLVFLCWLLSSSYPVVRDRITRIITHILRKDSQFTTKLIDKFKNVKDLYILERLICAVYGTVLLSEDNDYITNVANSIMSCIFKNGIVLPHIHLRHYARLIVERAHYLKLINDDDYNLCTPPYKSNINEITISDDESIRKLGTSNGTKLMLRSIGVMGDDHSVRSDFYRYILGGNTRRYSIFSKISSSNPFKCNETDYYTIDEIARIICNEVISMRWTDEIGELDNGEYSYGRFENQKERIGKKFQWIGLYSAIAKLVDNNHVMDYLTKKTVKYRNPLDIRYGDYFDPTLEIIELNDNELNSDDNISGFKSKIIKQYFTPKESITEGLFSDDHKPVVNNFIVDDNNGHQWVRISGMDVWKHGDPSVNELFYRYDTYFIDSNNLGEFTEWANKQNFYGRWMPEKRDCIEFRLNEYVWCSTYVDQDVKWSETPGKDCPCDVSVTTLTHLQEDFTGLTDGDNRNHTTALPCEDLFAKMNLRMSNQRGVILDSENTFAAIDVDIYDDSANGLYVRKDILDTYLLANNKSLVMCVLGSIEVIAGMIVINNEDISGYYYYDSTNGYIGDVYVGGKTEETDNIQQ